MSILLNNPKHINPYGYTPTKYVSILMVVLFGISTLLHIGQAIWTRKWYLLATAVLCGIAEVIGWSGRLWSSYGVYNITPFLMQISTTILAPTFLAAANFIILGTIINRIGPQYSRIPSKWYAIIFVSIDIISLVVQAIGGGMASKEVQTIGGNADKGGHIMLGGIIMQLVEMFIYVVLAVEFFVNYSYGKAVRVPKESERVEMPVPEHAAAAYSEEGKEATAYVHHEAGAGSISMMNMNARLMVGGLAFSTVTLFIRAIYRTAELSDGWGGRIIHTQVYFNVLDGAMIVLAMYTLNFIHPGFML